MELDKAFAIRDEMIDLARSLSRGRVMARSVLAESTGRREYLGRARPFSVSVGVAVGNDPGDYGIAVRSTAPRAFIEEEFLSKIRTRAERIDVKILEKIVPRQARLRIGHSVAHQSVGAGTLGAFVRDRGTGRAGILSNNHVLAVSNNAQVGDRILAPSPNDGGSSPSDEVATLHRFVRLRANRADAIDAAFALLDAPSNDPADIAGRIRLTGRTRDAVDNLQVAKNGRTTGFTTGRISAIGLDNVEMDYDGVVYTFDDQIEIASPINSPFSAGGDSGSLVVATNGDAVGLLFGGGPTSDGTEDLTFVNPIAPVLSGLNIDLVV